MPFDDWAFTRDLFWGIFFLLNLLRWHWLKNHPSFGGTILQHIICTLHCCGWDIQCYAELQWWKQPVLFPILKETLAVFAHWAWCWIWVCHWMAFIMRCIPSPPTFLRVFIINECRILSNAFSASINMMVFILHFVYVVGHIYWVADVVPVLTPLDGGIYV